MANGRGNNGTGPPAVPFRDALVHSLLFNGDESIQRCQDDIQVSFTVTVQPVDNAGNPCKWNKPDSIASYRLEGNADAVSYATAFLQEALDNAQTYINAHEISSTQSVRDNIVPFREATGNGSETYSALLRRHEKHYSDHVRAQAEAAEMRKVEALRGWLNDLKREKLKKRYPRHPEEVGLLNHSQAFQKARAKPDSITPENIDAFFDTRLNGSNLTVGDALATLGVLEQGKVQSVAIQFNPASTNSTLDNRESPVAARIRQGLKTSVPPFEPRSRAQALFHLAIEDHAYTFGIGTSGGGKTFEAIRMGLEMVAAGKVPYVTIVRAMTTTTGGKGIGEVPGDENKKVRRWFKAINETVEAASGGYDLDTLVKSGIIRTELPDNERGATLNGYIIVDEGQNLPGKVMADLLGRPGADTKFVVTGNTVNQIDIDVGHDAPGLLYVLDYYGRLKLNENLETALKDNQIGPDDIRYVKDFLDNCAFVNFPAESGVARNRFAPGLSILENAPAASAWRRQYARTFYSASRIQQIDRLEPLVEQTRKVLEDLHGRLERAYEGEATRRWPLLFEDKRNIRPEPVRERCPREHTLN